tara:strand:- start:215 stop:373 length:159 start_codon:yes stop_codon:yes gene_type:complete
MTTGKGVAEVGLVATLRVLAFGVAALRALGLRALGAVDLETEAVEGMQKKCI